MPTTTFIDGEVFNRHMGSDACARAKLIQDTVNCGVRLEDLRIPGSASNAQLPNAPDGTNLGLIVGTPGTTDFTIKGSDAQGTTKTETAILRFILPPEYVAGEAVSFIAFGGMETTVADASATLDVNCWAKDESDGSHGSELYSAAAVDINSLTLAARTFALTSTGLSPGDELTVKLTSAVTDSGALGVMQAKFTKFYFAVPKKG